MSFQPGEYDVVKNSDKTEKARLKALRPWFRKKRFILPIAYFLITGVAAGISGVVNSGVDGGQRESLAAATPTPDTEVTSETSQDLTSEAGLSEAISLKLGIETNRDVPRNVVVKLDGRDLSVGFALDDLIVNWATITEAWEAASDVIIIAQQSGLVDNLKVSATYELMDKYGNSVGEKNVFKAFFLEDSIPKINSSKFFGKDYEKVATEWWVHPTFLD